MLHVGGASGLGKFGGPGRSSWLAAWLLLNALPVPSTLAVGATRDLPPTVPPGQTFTVTIALDPPPGTIIAAAEDTPPTGWTISNISNGGSFDTPSGKVKWGLFFAPSIPTLLSYDLTQQDSGPPCFSGAAVFDGGEFPITGDGCIVAVPTLSTWGAVILGLALGIAGSRIPTTRQPLSKRDRMSRPG